LSLPLQKKNNLYLNFEHTRECNNDSDKTFL